MGRTARGVKAITLAEGDEVIGMSYRARGRRCCSPSPKRATAASPRSPITVCSPAAARALLNYHVDKYGDVAAIKVVDLGRTT